MGIENPLFQRKVYLSIPTVGPTQGGLPWVTAFKPIKPEGFEASLLNRGFNPVSVALSKEQFEWLAEAIAQWRTVQATLKEMQRLSRQVLFETVPHPQRRKRLAKKVLGTM